MEALPADALALVCAPARPDAERLLGCSRALRAAATEALYRTVAVERRGAAFWARARPAGAPRLRRHARRAARDPRVRGRARRGPPPWTDADFAAFWAYEAAAVARAARAREKLVGHGLDTKRYDLDPAPPLPVCVFVPVRIAEPNDC